MIDPRFDKVKYVVEATCFEDMTLYREWNKKVKWESHTSGTLETVGELNDKPVCFSACWASINGELVLFYHATSVVVDHDMIDKWLEDNCPNKKLKTNAMNFHIVALRVKK